MILTGFHSIEESLKKNQKGTLVVQLPAGPRVKQILSLVKPGTVVLEQVGKTEFQAKVKQLNIDCRGAYFILSETNKHPLVSLESYLDQLETTFPLFLALQEVTDPHNLGAIIRIADQFQASGVIHTTRRSASVTDTVSRASAGADQYVPVFEVTNLVQSLKLLQSKGFWIYGAHMDGPGCNTLTLSQSTVIVLGSEGKGLGQLVTDTCDSLISIPTQGNIDSLNVSVAAGILAYEVRRQQGFPFSATAK